LTGRRPAPAGGEAQEGPSNPTLSAIIIVPLSSIWLDAAIRCQTVLKVVGSVRVPAPLDITMTRLLATASVSGPSAVQAACTRTMVSRL
jgi:hypothetical protein